MPNHIITPTGDTQTHNQTLHLTPMLAKFKAGDSVLCPSLGNDIYTLAQHSDTVNFKHKVYFVGGQGEQQVFRPDGTEYKGGEQVIFHNTPANRQAIATLYGVTYDTMPAQSEDLKTIKSQYIFDLRLSLERLRMLEAVIDDVANTLRLANQHAHKHLIEPAKTRLGIGQILATNFIDSLQDDIAKIGGSHE